MGIQKLNLQEFLKENKGYKLLEKREHTTIFQLPDGSLLKTLDKELLDLLSSTGYDLETRLNEVDNLKKFSNFAWPMIMLEENGVVTTYVIPYIEGIDFTDYYESIFDLYSYAKMHSQFENNIKDGNNVGVVFPDLCTTENIRITPDGKAIFIDYDVLQIKKMPAVGFSTFLGDPRKVLTEKYYDFNTRLFSKEIDKKSAIFLYFVDVFGINLSTVDTINPQTGKIVTLDEIFSFINLTDDDVKQKVWKLYQPEIPNEFLGEDLYKLAENYRLVLPFPNAPTKMLIKK